MNMFRYLSCPLSTAHPPCHDTLLRIHKHIPLKNISNFSKKPKNNICTMNSHRWYHRVDGIIAFYVPAIFDVRERIPLFGFSEGRKISRSDNCLNFTSTFACHWEKYFPSRCKLWNGMKIFDVEFRGKNIISGLKRDQHFQSVSTSASIYI